MYSTTNQKDLQAPTATTTAGGEYRKDARNRHRVEAIFGIIGLIVLVIACLIMHTHPQPFPIDLAVTQALTQLQDVHLANAILQIPSFMGDTYTSIIIVSVLFIGTLLTGEVCRTQLIQIPSFPSGHTEHAVVFWGFLLYLSFNKPVREWRYHWLLIPLQIYAVFDILSIGVSRVVAEDHWITDILGGYLVGMLELCIFIILFRWATDWLARHRATKHAEKSAQTIMFGKHDVA